MPYKSSIRLRAPEVATIVGFQKSAFLSRLHDYPEFVQGARLRDAATLYLLAVAWWRPQSSLPDDDEVGEFLVLLELAMRGVTTLPAALANSERSLLVLMGLADMKRRFGLSRSSLYARIQSGNLPPQLGRGRPAQWSFDTVFRAIHEDCTIKELNLERLRFLVVKLAAAQQPRRRARPQTLGLRYLIETYNK